MSSTTTSSANKASKAKKKSNNWTGTSASNPLRNGVITKKGTFSKAESDIVRRAIEDFCNEKGITPERLCSSHDNRTDLLRGSWTKIAQCLPGRTVQSVYRHGVRILHPFKRGLWTEEELDELRLLVLRHGRAWALISNKLNRSADSCRDKHREFGIIHDKGRWSDEESANLIKIVRQLLKLPPNATLSEVKKVVVENRGNNVPWATVSKRMKNRRSRLACLKRFQQMSGIKADLTKAWKQRKLEEKMGTGEGLLSFDGPKGNKGASTNASESESGSKSKSKSKAGNKRSSTVKEVVSRKRSKQDRVQTYPDSSSSSSSSSEGEDSDGEDLAEVGQSSPERMLQEEPGAQAPDNTIEAAADPIPIHATNPVVTRAPAVVPVHVPIPIPVPAPTFGVTRIVADPTNQEGDAGYDRILLQTLASSSYNRETEVAWNAIRYPNGDAQTRWQEILDEYLETQEDVDEDDLLEMPVCEVAKILLENQRQAEMAAKTVDDVLLA